MQNYIIISKYGRNETLFILQNLRKRVWLCEIKVVHLQILVNGKLWKESEYSSDRSTRSPSVTTLSCAAPCRSSTASSSAWA